MSETSKTATLVGTPGMFATGANLLTATVQRGEIEGALALDPPGELFLDVVRRPEGSAEAEHRTVSVMWKRKDLELVLADPAAQAITFSFDPAELEAAIESSEVEGHGLRETAVVLTIAAAAAAAGASGALGAVSEGTSLSDRALAAPAATTIHTEASLTERGIVATSAAAHDEATFAARGIDAGTPAASHDEATFAARGIDAGSLPAVHDETTLAARGIDPGTPAASHDEATFAARGIDAGSLPAVHDETTLAARGIEPGTLPASTDGGSGFELPSVDPATAAGLAGGLAGAGLLIAAAAFATRRREPGTA
jgi:hypothetical protein